MRMRSTFGKVMDFAVSGYVYFVAVALVLYMVSTLVTTVFGTVTDLLNSVSTMQVFQVTPDIMALEFKLLHTIAFTIVLVKAYKILMSYAETQQINIKSLVELAIIAPTIEIVFNSSSYKLEIVILFALFAFANLVAYLFFYKTFKAVNADYLKENNCE